MQKTDMAQPSTPEWQCERCGKTVPRVVGQWERPNCPVCGSKMVPIVESANETKKLEKLED